MGVYDRYTMTLKGADNEAMDLNPISVTIWFYGAPDQGTFEGESTDYLGGYRLDNGAFRIGWSVECVEFGYEAGMYEGHDHQRLMLLRSVMAKRFKTITSVTGPDVIGSDGVAQYWIEKLGGGPVGVYVSSYEESNPYDNTTRVTFTINERIPL